MQRVCFCCYLCWPCVCRCVLPAKERIKPLMSCQCDKWSTIATCRSIMQQIVNSVELAIIRDADFPCLRAVQRRFFWYLSWEFVFNAPHCCQTRSLNAVAAQTDFRLRRKPSHKMGDATHWKTFHLNALCESPSNTRKCVNDGSATIQNQPVSQLRWTSVPPPMFRTVDPRCITKMALRMWHVRVVTYSVTCATRFKLVSPQQSVVRPPGELSLRAFGLHSHWKYTKQNVSEVENTLTNSTDCKEAWEIWNDGSSFDK